MESNRINSQIRLDEMARDLDTIGDIGQVAAEGRSAADIVLDRTDLTPEVRESMLNVLRDADPAIVGVARAGRGEMKEAEACYGL